MYGGTSLTITATKSLYVTTQGKSRCCSTFHISFGTLYCDL